jgi:PTH1 family peptidyl-tRNA hydrolase
VILKERVKLVVGLGNPGVSYRFTRHNAGAEAVGRFAKANGLVFKSNRSFKSLIAGTIAEGQTVCLVLPQTFMNRSGVAVAALVRKKNIAFKDILVVYDDAALLLGAIKMKARGSAGGHLGMASVIEWLGTQDFNRLRIGVDAPARGEDLADYCLSRFSKTEERIIHQVYKFASDAIEVWLTQGIDASMNRFNKKGKM